MINRITTADGPGTWNRTRLRSPCVRRARSLRHKDRVSNPSWRENPVATANSAEYDWKYGYDGLQRLKDGQRGISR